MLAGNRDALARWGNPLNILAGLVRASLCAADGCKLYWADYAAIESRVLENADVLSELARLAAGDLVIGLTVSTGRLHHRERPAGPPISPIPPPETPHR